MSNARTVVLETEVGSVTNPTAGGELSFRDLLTMIVWVGCLLVGAAGFVFHYPGPHRVIERQESVRVEVLDVQLTTENVDEALPDSSAAVTTQAPPIPAPLPPLQIPSAPSMTAVEVAAPTAVVAFSLPVAGPTRVVEVAKASFATPTVEAKPVVNSAPVVQTLILGSGEGRQPAPYYPAQAQRAGQEGTVRISLSVDEAGKVVTAEVATPCPWGLLNQAALKVVRERWRFPSGPFRLYEVAIRFELSK